MNLEVGKVYRTQDLQKATVLFIIPPEFRFENQYPAIIGIKNVGYVCMTLEGRVFHSNLSLTKLDLIAEWSDPEPKQEITVDGIRYRRVEG